MIIFVHTVWQINLHNKSEFPEIQATSLRKPNNGSPL